MHLVEFHEAVSGSPIVVNTSRVEFIEVGHDTTSTFITMMNGCKLHVRGTFADTVRKLPWNAMITAADSELSR
jgi:uncharacterized protein YlzI (FlbEa/FlbD family)